MQITKKSISNDYHRMHDHFHELYMALAESINNDKKDLSSAMSEIHVLWEDMESKFDIFMGDLIVQKKETD